MLKSKGLDDMCVCGHKRTFHSEKHCHGGSFCMCPVFVLSKTK